jgi:hypothetical protein
VRGDLSSGTLAVREWIATLLGTSLIVYEAILEHSAHREVYIVGLVLLGFVPFSLLDRALGRWGGDRDPEPPPPAARKRPRKT